MNWLGRFWSHTVVQISAWVVSILLSTLLGYYVALVAEKARELTYYVNPARAVIVKTGEASSLQVYHGGRPVTTDVSAVQVQIWNQGRDAIRQAHMLQPLVLSTADQTPILEATVRKQTRPDIVHLQLDDSAQESGRIKVSWDILEQGDGGIVQLVIAGKPGVNIKAEAVIEGQRHVHERSVVPPKDNISWVSWGLLGIYMSMFITVMAMEKIWARKWEKHGMPRSSGPLAIGAILFLIIMLYRLLRPFSSTPPWSFDRRLGLQEVSGPWARRDCRATR